MSGLAATFQTAFVEIIGEASIKFARLRVETDLADLAQRIINDRKAHARELFDEANAHALQNRLPIMGSFELFSILQKIRDEEPSIHEIYARASTPSGSKATIHRSLWVAGYSESECEKIIAQMSADTMATIARALITCNPVKPSKPQEAEPPLPSTPASSGDAAPPPTKIGNATVNAGYPDQDQSQKKPA